MRGRRHRRDANVVGIDAGARRDQPHIGVDHRIDGIHGDGVALEQCATLPERRLGIVAAGRRDVLAQHDLGERPVDGGGDGDQLLPAGAGAAERARRGLGELRRAGDHRIDRADAGDRHGLHLDAVLLPKPEVAGDIARREGHAERRIGQNDLLIRLRPEGRGAGGERNDDDRDGRNTHRRHSWHGTAIMESAAEPINAARCGIVVARGNCADDPDRAISPTKGDDNQIPRRT